MGKEIQRQHYEDLQRMEALVARQQQLESRLARTLGCEPQPLREPHKDDVEAAVEAEIRKLNEMS